MEVLNFNTPLPEWEQKAAEAIKSRRRYAIRDYIQKTATTANGAKPLWCG